MALSDLLGTLQQYAGGANNSANPERDFDHVAQNASQDHLAGGLASAFRSDATPPFAQMVSSLFSKSDGQQRAGILSRLLSAAGPGAGGLLGGLMGGGQGSGQITPEQAQQVSPEGGGDPVAAVVAAGSPLSTPPPGGNTCAAQPVRVCVQLHRG